jgi:hypothetical protein
MQCVACAATQLCRSGQCEAFDGGEYDASFPLSRDASVNLDAGVFDAGGAVDAGRDGGLSPDAGRSDAGRADAGVSFSNDVVPILNGCLGCHPNRATFSDARARVAPGNPTTSLLYQKMIGTQASGNAMPPPPQPPLVVSNPDEVSTIERWIQQGALNN